MSCLLQVSLPNPYSTNILPRGVGKTTPNSSFLQPFSLSLYPWPLYRIHSPTQGGRVPWLTIFENPGLRFPNHWFRSLQGRFATEFWRLRTFILGLQLLGLRGPRVECKIPSSPEIPQSRENSNPPHRDGPPPEKTTKMVMSGDFRTCSVFSFYFGSTLKWEILYHPFQNHYTHKITIFELGDYSYSFQGSVELICITVTVSLFLLHNAVTEKNSPQEFSGGFEQLQLHKLIVFELKV